MSYVLVILLIFVGTLSFISGFILEEESGLLHGLHEKFELKPLDKADCKWVEHRNPGAGPREFRINCRLGQGKTYNCIYKANPHSCGWYNQGNQYKFYRGLAREAASNQPNACNRHSLVYKKCPDVHFLRLA
ncbi:hypothetical protein CHS0354_030539 [Potamilus streckersoni]|uniref:Uncharacterized protein n=1 Tax=Potamilus streckersoni TaxID=2493646 RepID=A0AAE0RPL2_9BIVA|nr:hypothetical protein CHS0354_030539 [Potamilus streckersoni]